MINMRLQASALALLCATQQAQAWAPASSSVSSFRRSSISSSINVGVSSQQRRGSHASPFALKATVEGTDTTPVAVAVADPAATATSLSPEYQGALDHAKATLQKAIPTAYHATMLPLLEHFVSEYMAAAESAAAAGYESEMNQPEATATRILTGIQYGLQYGTGPNKYTFDVTHTAVRKGDLAPPGVGESEKGAPDHSGVDFYQFGNDFFRSAMDLPNSVVTGIEQFQQMVQQIEAGENVVLLANHQSEADPQVVSCCMEMVADQVPGLAEMAANVVYVAGHKVTTDALAIPFSMGRNLLCIHSKKHIDADKESKPTKQRQNLRAMSGLLKKLKLGGQLLWVAPSGGRDRRDMTTGQVPLAMFDSKTIDMFRLMGNKSQVKTHYYTFAMVSYDLCPPPDFVEAGTGESRQVRFCPVGIGIGKEVESIGGLEGRHEFCEHAYAQCTADYLNLQVEIEQKVNAAVNAKQE
jgi:glycerol-3-phosphate O-acyltransferase